MTVLKDAASGAKSDNCDDPLLRVRLAPPTAPHRFLDRARLSAVLDRASGVPLTLVSGPAGSGKTALAAAWVTSRADTGATEWMTFDEGEVPPERFWADLLECLRRHGADVRARRRGAAGGHRHAAMQVAVAVASLTEPLTVVMDGCELVSADLAGDLDFVLRHSGGLLHVVILTRVDPALPLHRYRLEDTVEEVRTADLAFSEEETARLVELYDVELARGSVRALHRRTRGWVAALRFALMVLQRSDAPDAAVDQLAGDRGNIAEYLMEEVLRTQSEDVQDLLMATSVVEVLPPGLIEELVGPAGAHGLEALARANVLVEAVADRPGWYRYHPLLRDLLRAELAHRMPGERLRLHLAAARWFARENDLGHAVELAAEVGAWVQATRFVVDELAVGRLALGRALDDVARVMGSMPRDIDDPGAAVVRAGLSLADDDLAVCARELSRARALAATDESAHGRCVQLSVDLVDALRACRAEDPEAVSLADRVIRDAQDHGGGRGAQPHTQTLSELRRARDAAAARRHPVLPAQRRAPVTIATDTPSPDQVIEPLTGKELEVLGHLSELLSTEEIAGAMFVSVNTVRTHVRSILRKLAVSRRNEAVRRGRALGLIAA